MQIICVSSIKTMDVRVCDYIDTVVIEVINCILDENAFSTPPYGRKLQKIVQVSVIKKRNKKVTPLLIDKQFPKCQHKSIIFQSIHIFFMDDDMQGKKKRIISFDWLYFYLYFFPSC
jgi:hypothetical protein